MNIFLTGEIQVGKSTIIRRWIEANSALKIGGFRTVPGPADGEETDGVYIIPARGGCALCEENRIMLRHGAFPHRDICAYPKVFNTVGVSLLKQSVGCDIVLMDEIGINEDTATAFQNEVKLWLDSGIPVLGVVRNKPGILTDIVRRHYNVRVITVTVENREKILKELLAWKG